MARIAAHDEHNAATTYDFALVANALNAGFNFHVGTLPRGIQVGGSWALKWR
jgi:hypothetical protein